MEVASKHLEALTSYASAFRDLINARVWRAPQNPARALRLSSEADWSFICVAMDVVGDAALAIENFLQFSLSGPTRYDNIGEKYLRLYGLLSAAYLQQEAIVKLYRLMNCANPRDVEEKVNALQLRTLRHQVASHSVDYRDRADGRLRAFVPIRIGLGEFSCEVTEGRGDRNFTVKLDEAASDHCVVLTDTLDTIYEKSIKTIFRGQPNRVAEFQEKLIELRDVRAGRRIVIGNGYGTVHFVHADKDETLDEPRDA